MAKIRPLAVYNSGTPTRTLDAADILDIPKATNNWYVAMNGDDITGDGSQNYPFATFLHTQSIAADGDTIFVAGGFYTETWTVMKSFTINGSGQNSVFVDHVVFDGSGLTISISGVTVVGTVSNLNDTGGWTLNNCTINGDIDITGGIGRPVWLSNCSNNALISISVNNTNPVYIYNGFYRGNLQVSDVNSVVYVYNVGYFSTVTHNSGAVYLFNIAYIEPDIGTGVSILSTATNGSSNNYISMNRIGTANSSLVYGLINKTGNCPYSISSDCNIALTGNVFTGTQTLLNVADYMSANYTPSNYTPTNTSVKGHLQGINSALSASTQIATQAQTDNGYSTSLAVGVAQMKVYNSKNDFLPTIIGRPQANLAVSVAPTGRVSSVYDFYSIAWSSKLGLFAAVSSTSNKIVTSTDGVTWTDQTSTAAQWRTICWSPELAIFVAVAQTGQINTSTDGVTWTNRTSPAANGWSCICWSAERTLFVVVAISGTQKTMTSPDGVTWTLRTPSSDAPLWYVVTWANTLGLFVSGGSAGNFMTSPDGVTWTAVSQAVNNNTCTSLTFSTKLGMLVAGFSTGTAGNKILTSTNATTWTGRTIAATAINSVVWSPELEMLYAVANDPTNAISTSFDGITWTTRTKITDNTNIWTGTCWSPELGVFCSVSSSGTGARIMTSLPSNGLSIGTQVQLNTGFSNTYTFSIDQFKKYNYIATYMPTIWGIPQGNFVASGTYTARTTPASIGYAEVCYSTELNLFVAVSGNGGSIGLARVATSNDSINWTSQNASNDSAWASVCWSPQLNLFVSVSAGSLIMSSPDGVTWTNRNSTGGRTYSSVCWSPQQARFIAVSAGSAYMWSNDGITWTSGSMPVNISWQSVCYSPELDIFVAVAGTGTGTNQIATLANGATTWTTRTSVAGFWQSVCWANKLSLFVAVSSSGTNNIMTSPDGITWTIRTPSETFGAQYVLWCPEIGLLTSVGTAGTTKGVMTSIDGITWTVRATAPNTNTWLGACWAAPLGAVVAVSGVNATSCIMTSKSAHNTMTGY